MAITVGILQFLGYHWYLQPENGSDHDLPHELRSLRVRGRLRFHDLHASPIGCEAVEPGNSELGGFLSLIAIITVVIAIMSTCFMIP